MCVFSCVFFFQAEDGIRDLVRSRGLGDVYKRQSLVIGTIKTLEKRYGIEFLIRAFANIKRKNPNKIKLLICGKGTLLDELKNLTVELGVQDDTIFTGYINHDQVQFYHNKLDIYVAPSLEESFGVAVLEASACNKPVVAVSYTHLTLPTSDLV